MGFFKKIIKKVIKPAAKVLQKVVAPVTMIPGVGSVIKKVASPISMIPGPAGKVLGGIVQGVAPRNLVGGIAQAVPRMIGGIPQAGI